MPYQNLADGLYLIQQPAQKDGLPVTHFGVLDVGNCFQLSGADPMQPTIVHQTPPNIRADRLEDTQGQWTLVKQITDVSGARVRLQEALGDPNYRVLKNNCEHLANFVADGVRSSPQVAGGVAITLFSVFVLWCLKEG